MAPVFDSGSCKHLDGELPETVGMMKINGLYSTEKELLSKQYNGNSFDNILVVFIIFSPPKAIIMLLLELINAY